MKQPQKGMPFCGGNRKKETPEGKEDMTESKSLCADARIIISKDDRKREIGLPFGICGSREALTAIRDSLNVWLNDPGNGCGIVYGWCRIDPPRHEEYVFGHPNTHPEAWDE